MMVDDVANEVAAVDVDVNDEIVVAVVDAVYDADGVDINYDYSYGFVDVKLWDNVSHRIDESPCYPYVILVLPPSTMTLCVHTHMVLVWVFARLSKRYYWVNHTSRVLKHIQ